MSLFTEREQKVFIEGPCGELEAYYHTAKIDTGRQATVIICHPHPQFGGTMDNKVVTTLARLYREIGVNAIRFNFRGVGASAGSYGGTEGEHGDLLSVIGRLKNDRPEDELLLAGFSFGSFIAFRGAAGLPRVGHLLLIAPPVDRYSFDNYDPPPCPVCVVQGGEDDVVEASGVWDWVAAQPFDIQLIKIDDAGHFFHGKLVELKQLLIPKLSKQLRLAE